MSGSEEHGLIVWKTVVPHQELSKRGYYRVNEEPGRRIGIVFTTVNPPTRTDLGYPHIIFFTTQSWPSS